MKQLTVRGFGDKLSQAIRRLANRDGTSLNRAAVKLMRRGAGLDEGQGPDTVGSSLRELCPCFPFGSRNRDTLTL